MAGNSRLVEPAAVYLIPLDDFPYDYASQLAGTLSKDLGLNVRATLPMGTADLSPFPDAAQYSVEDIIENASKVGSRLLDSGERSATIALTSRDINDRSRTMRFLFAQHDKGRRTSVISAARMRYGTPAAPATPDKIFLRIYKITKRTIGEQYLGLSRSGNINDLMYAPIMSLDDLDALGMQFAARSSTAKAAEAKPEDALMRIDQMARALNGSCSYPMLEKNRQNKELVCMLDTLRNRCNKIDDCYVYCIGNDVGVAVGGGCTHLCNYSLREQWDPPKTMEACKTQ